VRTPVCELLGIEQPIMQAPIGSAACPRLAAAVSNAGALGMLGLTWVADVAGVIVEAAALTDRPSAGISLSPGISTAA
jgi:nitronate monooxygenase